MWVLKSWTKINISLMLLLNSAAYANHLSPGDAPAPGQVAIQGVSYRGAGCLPGTASYVLSPDLSSLTVLFDRYSVEAGGEVSEVGQKSCAIDVNLKLPDGWSYSIFAVDFRGFVGLDAGTFATQSSSYSFGSNPAPVSLGNQKFQGPISNNFNFSSEVPVATQSWSSCGAGAETLRIKTSIRTEGDLDHHAQMTLDSMDGSIEQHYVIQWKRCGGNSELANVYRFRANSRLFYYTASREEGAQLRMTDEKIAFQLFKSDKPILGLVPLYRCSTTLGSQYKFVTLSSNCDIDKIRGIGKPIPDVVLGYLSVKPLPGFVPLYRFSSKGGIDIGSLLKDGTFLGTDINEGRNLGISGQQILGYVPGS